VPFSKATPGTTEVTSATADSGSQTVTNVINTPGTFEIYGGQCAIKSIHGFFENQKTVYVFLVLSTGAIRGQEITKGTMEQIKAKVHSVVMEGTTAEPEKVQLTMNYEEKFQKRMVAVLPDNFSVSDLEDTNVSDMDFTHVDDTLTSLTIDVTTPCQDVDTLSRTGAGNFVLVNTTDNSAVTITGITGSGNRYILAFAAQTEGDAFKLYYKSPKVSNELFELTEENALTGKFTAL